MTVHALHTKSAPDEITAAEAVRRYAEYLKEQSFCLDESSWPMMALHIQSNTESLADSLRNGFPDWAKAEKIRVKASDYHAFLQSLTQRLTYIMPRVRATSFRPVPERIFTNT